jgi:hypothetical protein
MEKQKVWWWVLGGFIFVILVAVPWCLCLERKDALTASIAIAGVIGVVFTIRQTQKRITLQERQQRDARFAQGVELLGNPHESTRIGGAYNLYFLARDFEELRPAVCEILCAHLRTIAHKSKFETDEQRENIPKMRYKVSSTSSSANTKKRTESMFLFFMTRSKTLQR